MSRPYAKRFIELGEIAISSNEYFEKQYRSMEVKNEFINDPFEGKIEFDQNTPIDSLTATQEEREAVREFFGHDLASYGRRTLVKGNRISERSHPFFMLCFTLSGPPDGDQVFFRPQPGYSPYDSCIRVRKLNRFFRDLWRYCRGFDLITGTEIDMDRTFHTQLRADVVTYSPVKRNWSSGLPRASAFRKDPIFSNQQEFRMVIHPIAPVGTERILLKVPEITKYLSLSL
jgi:hypothetical protein